MIAYVRHKDILGELYLPAKEKSNGIGLVWLPGLPNKPMAEDMGKPLAELGFTVLQARYPGNWQSYGDFGPATSLDGAILGLELLSSGQTINLNNQEEVSWDLKHLVLVGVSYGGGIAISALGTSNLADAAIALCPLIEPQFQNADPAQPEDELATLYPYLRRCHENVYRNLDDEEWLNYIQGNHIAIPGNYAESLKEKPLLLIHGTEDQAIRHYHTEKFYDGLKRAGSERVEMDIVEGIGHGTELRTASRDNWIQWLKELFGK